MSFKSIAPSKSFNVKKGATAFEDNPVPKGPKLRFKELPKMRMQKLKLIPHPFSKKKI